MGMTITEKILAAHAGNLTWSPEKSRREARPRTGNDITAPLSLEEFDKVGAKGVFDRDKVVLVLDHFAPNKDISRRRTARR